MAYKSFKYEDIFYNTIITNPEYKLFVDNGNSYLNKEVLESGMHSNKVKHVTQGYISLHEKNISRPENSLIYPFITKDGTRTSFRTMTTKDFQDSSQFKFGDVIKGKYPLSASINRIFIRSGAESNVIENGEIVHADPNKKYIRALRTSIENNAQYGKHYKYDSKGTDPINLICIPGIFYGSSVEKGSIELNYYIRGNLTATLKDKDKNGALVQTYGNQVGKTAGLVLYNQGLILLTGSSNLDTVQSAYFDTANSNPSWLTFGTGLPEIGKSTNYGTITNPSYEIKFRGTNKIPTLTMMAHAEKGELNYSNNPTFIDKEKPLVYQVSTNSFSTRPGKIKNIKKSKYKTHKEDFENTVFISKIGIYDKDKNLLAIATLANPVKKTEIDDYTFKLRLDF